MVATAIFKINIYSHLNKPCDNHPHLVEEFHRISITPAVVWSAQEVTLTVKVLFLICV